MTTQAQPTLTRTAEARQREHIERLCREELEQCAAKIAQRISLDSRLSAISLQGICLSGLLETENFIYKFHAAEGAEIYDKAAEEMKEKGFHAFAVFVGRHRF